MKKQLIGTALILVAALGFLMPTPTTLSQQPPPTTTPDPVYAPNTIDALVNRAYGGGQLEIVDTLFTGAAFNRYLIKYPSDGLDIYGFLNVPQNTDGAVPVIIAIHGYIDPAQYNTLDYTTHYADDLARAGFLVLHPNLRGYFPSDDGPNLFRVGMAVDVLNLVALVRAQSGQPGPLALADPDSIGLWGHSMGGGISLRAITVDPEIDAAVLYGAMSGDEGQNFRMISIWSDGQRGQDELKAPSEVLAGINPIEHLDRIQAAVSIHHGQGDELVPVDWSITLCSRLQLLGKSAECFLYPGQPHTFRGESDDLFMDRTITFFRYHLQ